VINGIDVVDNECSTWSGLCNLDDNIASLILSYCGNEYDDDYPTGLDVRDLLYKATTSMNTRVFAVREYTDYNILFDVIVKNNNNDNNNGALNRPYIRERGLARDFSEIFLSLNDSIVSNELDRRGGKRFKVYERPGYNVKGLCRASLSKLQFLEARRLEWLHLEAGGVSRGYFMYPTKLLEMSDYHPFTTALKAQEATVG